MGLCRNRMLVPLLLLARMPLAFAMEIPLGQLVSFRHDYGYKVVSGTPNPETIYAVIGALMNSAKDQTVTLILEDQASLFAPTHRQVVIRVSQQKELADVCALEMRDAEFHKLYGGCCPD